MTYFQSRPPQSPIYLANRMTLEQALERIADREREISRLEDEVRKYRTLAGFDKADKLGRAVGVGGAKLMILTMLMSRQECSREALIDAMYGDRPDGGPEYAKKIIDISICKLRRKLVPFGVTIKTVWNWGYSIGKEDQQVLRALAADRCNE